MVLLSGGHHDLILRIQFPLDLKEEVGWVRVGLVIFIN